jgi:hypothetical protein
VIVSAAAERRQNVLAVGWLLTIVISAVTIAALNYSAVHAFHTIDKHLTFRDRIIAGFPVDPILRTYPTPSTFPMWGYGWVLLVTTYKPALLAIQIAAATAAAWFFVAVVERADAPNRWPARLLRAGILVCTPWYVYHSIDWSQSLATSALILSAALLVAACHARRRRARWLIASAVCFGVNLNFASDLYLLPFAIAATYWWLQRERRTAPVESMAWLAAVFATLVPWMIYSEHVVGAPLIKSTNQGHVLLIGLGQDPDHRFDVTYSDGDPTMYANLDRALGRQRARQTYESCSFEADPELRRAFLERVMARPLAYLDLVRWRLTQVLRGRVGVYAGEFDSPENAGRFGVSVRIRRSLRLRTVQFGSRLQLITTVLLPFAAWAAVRRRSAALTLAVVTIMYQYVSCSIAVMQPQYVQNLLMFQLLVCAEVAGMWLTQIAAIPSIGRVPLAHA